MQTTTEPSSSNDELEPVGTCGHCQEPTWGPCASDPLTCVSCWLAAVEFLEAIAPVEVSA